MSETPYKDIKTDVNKSSDVVWHQVSVSHENRVSSNGHRPVVLWYTGLSGSGKSTVANAVDKMLHDLGCKTYLLDGDNIRHGLNGDLGFSDKDRIENIRRIGEVSKLFVDAGMIVSTAFISPFVADREQVKALLKPSQFVEIFIDTPIEVCEQRDPKGLYKKARAGEIKNFTGIDSDYERPLSPQVHVESGLKNVRQCAQQIIRYLQDNDYLKE